MPKKRKDTEYLSISARIRVMENRLLTRNRMERMLEARTDEETAKVLSECGYGELTDLSPTAVDAAMVRARDALCRDLEQGTLSREPSGRSKKWNSFAPRALPAAMASSRRAAANWAGSTGPPWAPRSPLVTVR